MYFGSYLEVEEADFGSVIVCDVSNGRWFEVVYLGKRPAC